MDITIHQGRNNGSQTANITIVIDVIRAFTVAHYAFLQGAKRIYLAESVEEAFQLKEKHPQFLLVGEVEGLPIKGFDFGNSPFAIQKENLEGKSLIQKTTNGVRATLNYLSSDHLFVTGFTNARRTADYVNERLLHGDKASIQIIASHPSGQDDYACAEYIKHILEGNDDSISMDQVIEEIVHSHVAKKFFDENNPAFLREDILCCIKELESDFVMKVDQSSKIPMIERVQV